MGKSEKEQKELASKCVDLAIKDIKKHTAGCERVLITYHVIKDDQILHYTGHYANFPRGDWQSVLQSIANEANKSTGASTAKSKVG